MKEPRVGIGVFIKDKKGKYAFLKRKGSHGAGTWALAGGALEHGETFEECAKREVMEEMGIEIENVQMVLANNSLFEENDSHWVTIIMLAEHKSGELKIMEEDKASDIGWFTLKEIQKKELFHPLELFFSEKPFMTDREDAVMFEVELYEASLQ